MKPRLPKTKEEAQLYADRLRAKFAQTPFWQLAKRWRIDRQLVHLRNRFRVEID
jgi:hypothetical protein